MGRCCRVRSSSACLRVGDAVAGDLSVSADAVLLYGRLTQSGDVSHLEDLAGLMCLVLVIWLNSYSMKNIGYCLSLS